MTTSEHTTPVRTEEPTALFYMAEVLSHWRRFIIINVGTAFVLTTIVAFLLPNWYKSTASILPPKQQDIFGAAAGASSLLKGIAGGKLLGNIGRNNGTYNYMAILRSRTTMDMVINKFDLLTVYDYEEKDRDKVLKELESNTFFEVQDDENITIEVLDKDSSRAAAMANTFVEILNTTSIQLATQEARNNREFIERRVNKCREDLRTAEDAMKTYQEKKDLIITDDVKNSSVSGYAELYALKAKKEIEISVLEKMVAADNQTLLQLRSELNEITKKVKLFPANALEGVRLYQEVLIQSKMLEFLLPLYEQAKIDEQKDIPVLLVIDKAVPAKRKTKPQRMFIIVLVTALVLSVVVSLTFFFHSMLRQSGVTGMKYRLRQRVLAVMRLYGVPLALMS